MLEPFAWDRSDMMIIATCIDEDGYMYHQYFELEHLLVYAKGLHDVKYVESETVLKRDFYGYNSEKELFTAFYCKDRGELYKVKNELEFETLYETKLDPIFRFLHQNDLRPNQKFETIGSLLMPCTEELAPFPKCFMAFDIEAYNKDYLFPDAERGDIVTHIACVYKNQTGVAEYMYSLAPCTVLSDKHYVFESEYDLLDMFRKDVLSKNPHVILSYNGDGFDMYFLLRRMVVHGICTESDFLGSLKMDRVQEKINMFGKTYNSVILSGRIHEDLMVFMFKNFNLSDYSLNSVCEKYLGEVKDDVSVRDIFDSYKKKDKALSTKVAKYCLQDTMLVLKLYEKLQIHTTNTALSNLTFVPYQMIISRGQQIKMFSLLHYEANKRDIVIPNIEPKESEQYQGATVLSPQKGLYKDPVITLDFASLYPSIMMRHNLCYMSYITDPSKVDVEYESFPIAENKVYYFAKDCESLCPLILENLGKQRKVYKKEMRKYEEGTFDYELNDKRQLACKLAMNSLYGFTAANMIQCKPISETITYVGRKMIEKTKNCVESNYVNAQCIYGDSVLGSELTMIKDVNGICFVPIEDLQVYCHPLRYNVDTGDIQWSPYMNGKEYLNLYNVHVADAYGFTKVKRIIRHKVCSSRLVHVETTAGSIICTKDHSLLRDDGSSVAPLDLHENEPLLNSYIRGEVDLRNIMLLPDVEDAIRPDAFNSLDCLFNAPFVTVKKALSCLEKVSHPDRYQEKLYHFMMQINNPGTEALFKRATPFETQVEVYVYDLETGSHHFNAGSGNVIVHNTDSVFIKMKDMKVERALEVGQEMAEFVTDSLFRKPILLEFEKVYYPLILVQKKMYMGMKYQLGTDRVIEDNKGVPIKRRDKSLLVKNMYVEIRNIFFMSLEPKAYARDYIKTQLDALTTGRMNIGQFSINTGLKVLKDYKSAPNTLIKKMTKRNPEDPPMPGDRVSYVFIKGSGVKSEDVDDARYVQANGIPIDYDRYVEGLFNEIGTLLSVLFTPSEINAIFYPYMNSKFKRKHAGDDPKQCKLSRFIKCDDVKDKVVSRPKTQASMKKQTSLSQFFKRCG